MEIPIPIEKLRTETKLFIATPMYGGMCHGIFTKSLVDVSTMFAQYGIPVIQHFIFNESLIQRARNYICDEFLRSDATHLLFIDADIGFNAQDILAMLSLHANDPERYDVLAAPYPKKTISWEKIKQAVDKGMADDNPGNLEKYVGDYVFNVPDSKPIQLFEPAEVLETGTGFMMIPRSTFDKYKAAYPQFSYKPDHARTQHFDGSREIHAYFDCIIDPVSKRYLSEDYLFCQNVRKMGSKVWLCPWMKLQHAGTMIFGGSLIDLAQIGATATVDPSKIKK